MCSRGRSPWRSRTWSLPSRTSMPALCARWPAMPDVPLFGEQGYPALDRFTGWWGVFAPAGTSPATIDQIAAAFNEALRDPNIRKRIEGANAEPTGTTPAEFTQIVRTDLARW